MPEKAFGHSRDPNLCPACFNQDDETPDSPLELAAAATETNRPQSQPVQPQQMGSRSPAK
jgi:hypothetical protein